MKEKEIHEALDTAINSNPLNRKAFDDIQHISGPNADADREKLIGQMTEDMGKEIGFKSGIEKIGAFFGRHGHTEESYENMDARFYKALEKDIPGNDDASIALRKTIAQEAADNYVAKVHGEKYNPNHHDAMQTLVATGIDMEVKKGIDDAFASSIPAALDSKLPGPIAALAMKQIKEGINRDELTDAVAASVKNTYTSEAYAHATDEQKHGMIAQATKDEFAKRSNVFDLSHTDIGKAGMTVLDAADNLSRHAGLNLGLSDEAKSLNLTANKAATLAISGEVADKVVPGQARGTQANLMDGAKSAAHDVIGEVAHGLSGLFGGGKGRDASIG